MAEPRFWHGARIAPLRLTNEGRVSLGDETQAKRGTLAWSKAYLLAIALAVPCSCVGPDLEPPLSRESDDASFDTAAAGAAGASTGTTTDNEAPASSAPSSSGEPSSTSNTAAAAAGAGGGGAATTESSEDADAGTDAGAEDEDAGVSSEDE